MATGKGGGVSENCQSQGNPLGIWAYFYGESSQGAEEEEVRRNWGSFVANLKWSLLKESPTEWYNGFYFVVVVESPN